MRLSGWRLGVAVLALGILPAVPFARADDVAAMISQYRREHGLSVVRTDAQLTAVAERQARAMAASGIMDHGVAAPFASRIAGVATDSAGENIAAGTKTWADTLRIWKASPGHNENLLRPDADIVGVAVAHNDATHYKTFWAMVIGHKEPRVMVAGRGKQQQVTMMPWGSAPPVEHVATTHTSHASDSATPSALSWVSGVLASGRKMLFGQ
jgi:hypothetical protein